jgi:hypothetical protein
MIGVRKEHCHQHELLPGAMAVMIADGRKIRAIARMRQVYHIGGLKEAKAYINGCWPSIGRPDSEPHPLQLQFDWLIALYTIDEQIRMIETAMRSLNDNDALNVEPKDNPHLALYRTLKRARHHLMLAAQTMHTIDSIIDNIEIRS